MRVAFFLGGLNRGGTEMLILDVFRKMDVAPFDAILIYRNEGNLSEDYRATGVPMIRIKPSGFRIIGYIRQLRSVLEQERIDILHTHTLLNAFMGLFCVCCSARKLVSSFHGLFTSFRGRIMTRAVLWFTDASVFVSNYVRQWYLGRNPVVSPKRCHVVYNGIEFSRFDHRFPVPDFLEMPTSPGQKPCVKLAMVGSFVSVRAQDFLCRCIKGLREQGMDGFQLFFIGRRSAAEPERYDACVRFCQQNDLMDVVHFMGEREDIPAILQHIDGFVYSTNEDTFGIAVVEALAAGVPVLVNDWDVMREITDDGQLACLYKTQAVEDCIRKLGDFILNVNSYESSARANAHIIRERFCIERHIQSLNAVYNSL